MCEWDAFFGVFLSARFIFSPPRLQTFTLTQLGALSVWESTGARPVPYESWFHQRSKQTDTDRRAETWLTFNLFFFSLFFTVWLYRGECSQGLRPDNEKNRRERYVTFASALGFVRACHVRQKFTWPNDESVERFAAVDGYCV